MKNRKGKDLPGILLSFGGALVLFFALLLGLGWGLVGSMVPSVIRIMAGVYWSSS